MPASVTPSGLTPAAEIRDLIGKADGAARANDLAAARRGFVEAAVCAQSHGMWRAAMRCYRRALELDLCDRELVGRIATIAGKLGGDGSTTAAHSTRTRGRASAAAPRRSWSAISAVS
jgi:hypothetical protein